MGRHEAKTFGSMGREWVTGTRAWLRIVNTDGRWNTLKTRGSRTWHALVPSIMYEYTVIERGKS